MESFKDFFVDILNPFFHGLTVAVSAIFDWIFGTLNIVNYVKVISDYSDELSFSGWLLVILTIVLLLAFYILIGFLVYKLIKKYIKYRRTLKSQSDLDEEMDLLKAKLSNYEATNNNYSKMLKDSKNQDVLEEGQSRFIRLTEVDEKMANLKLPQGNETITLKEFCDTFRNYAASELKLYYSEQIIRLFIASLATSKVIIFQGISGTGKTSLAYAFGKFLNNDVCVSAVQPSWRDSSEVFGYFNEFTKKFNETDLLVSMYEAGYKDRVYIGVLDEMNISRVEYYFAEMLSLLEMPQEDYRILTITASGWDTDPKKIVDGKIKIPNNMWFIGTINNDDSTFMVTDKVYDRAIPINIDTKVEAFEAPKTESLEITYTYLNKLFLESREKNKISDDLLSKLDKTDKYLIEHFKISFGNRIIKQLKDFTPAYMATGGSEIEAFDYILANKILRKLNQLNLSVVRKGIDDFIKFLNDLYGKDELKESIRFLEEMKLIA